MPITLDFIQGAQKQSAVGVPTIAFPSATTKGSFLLAWYVNGGPVALNSGTVTTDTLGNTWVLIGTLTMNQSGTVVNPNCMFWVCVSNTASGANTVQFKNSAPSTDQGTLAVAEFTAQATSSPLDNSAGLSYTITSSTQQNLATVTLAGANETVIAMYGCTFAGNLTAGTGYVIPAALDGQSGAGLEYGGFSTSPQTPTISTTTGTGGFAVAMVISVKNVAIIPGTAQGPSLMQFGLGM
jgi:hypothetical protein